MDFVRETDSAADRIQPYIRRTPLEYSTFLSKVTSCSVYLKLENTQVTHSFKIRGAMNKILCLNEQEKKRGVITASSGNHGAAFAYCAQTLGLDGTVYVPENVSPIKLKSLKMYDISIEKYGSDCLETENYARKKAENDGKVYVPPYNDPDIIAGQGTTGWEIIRQNEKIDTVFVPVGGGGLISGTGGYLKQINPDVKIIGCQPEHSPVMKKSVEAGKIIQIKSKPTISDGTAGGIEENSITFEYCCKFIDEFILVSEKEIKDAIRLLIENHHTLAEGSGALAVAAMQRSSLENRNCALIISGARISVDMLQKSLF